MSPTKHMRSAIIPLNVELSKEKYIFTDLLSCAVHTYTFKTIVQNHKTCFLCPSKKRKKKKEKLYYSKFSFFTEFVK